uniref:BGL01 n=1 Tax=Arundo donax TaxID=35708 RepID=A0A0A9CN01_ARUDO
MFAVLPNIQFQLDSSHAHSASTGPPQSTWDLKQSIYHHLTY